MRCMKGTMGNSPAQRRQKELRRKQKLNLHNKQKVDPRTSEISIGGPVKITKADGTVEYRPASPGWRKVLKKDYLKNPYGKPRPRKY